MNRRLLAFLLTLLSVLMIIPTMGCQSSFSTPAPAVPPQTTPPPTPQSSPPTTPVSPSPKPSIGKIVFSSDRDVNIDNKGYALSRAVGVQLYGNIYVMNEDGSNVVRLTDTYLDFSPQFSPDGTKIAFSSSRDKDYEIYIMNSDGSNQRRLTNSAGADYDLNWSPDGKKIVFTSERDGNSEIYVMDINGDNVKRLTNNQVPDERPNYSPDGTRIVFQSNRDDREIADIYMMNSDGTNTTRLTNGPGSNVAPVFSPDGEKIVFSSTRDTDKDFEGPYNFEIYIMNSDGSNQKRLTHYGSNPKGIPHFPGIIPTWSPNGDRIAFERFQNDNWEIFIMNVDGSNERYITNNPSYDVSPSWR